MAHAPTLPSIALHRPARRLRRRRLGRRGPDDRGRRDDERRRSTPTTSRASRAISPTTPRSWRARPRSSRALAEEYDALAKSVDYDYARLLAEHREEVSRILEDAKKTWIEANPYYEQVEGVVAGTPSLAEYDIILDAGSSKEEDPESAVPFDLKLSDGRVLEQPGNLFNLTEGMLWGTRPDLTGQAEADLDGDGKVEFGEALPDALVLASAAEAFERYAAELDTEAQAWGPTASDAFTALVVMVPTMSEYFGQWKESRFVQGDAAEGDAFNVVSRLSDINDIISGLEIVYDGVETGDRDGRPGRAPTRPARSSRS